MQYPNGRYFSASPGRFLGGTNEGFSLYTRGRGDRFNRFINAQWSRINGGLPSGYGVASLVPPLRAGGMAGYDSNALALVTGDGAGNLGCQISGSTTHGITETATLSLLAALAASVSLTLTVSNATLGGLVSISASDTLTSTLTGTLSATAFIAGSASASLSETANLTGSGSMQGVISPFSELSPENLASAVWNYTQ